jgi:hypothetical protein
VDTDFSASGLKARSVIRLSRLVSVEAAIINANLGEISSEWLQAIKKRLIDWPRE